jgi:hypothetical protein
MVLLELRVVQAVAVAVVVLVQVQQEVKAVTAEVMLLLGL